MTIKVTEMSLMLQRIEVKLSKGKYEVEDLGHGTQIQYKIRTVGLYLVIESAIGLAVMWDRKTTVRILLEPQHSVSHSNCLVMMTEVSCSKSFNMVYHFLSSVV